MHSFMHSRRMFSGVFFALLTVLVFSCNVRAKDTGSPTYRNARYGFTVTLPEGDWKKTEAENGDGATFSSVSLQSRVRVYGTQSYAVFGKGIEDAFNEAAAWFSGIGDKKLNTKKGTFRIMGTNDRHCLQEVLCSFTEENAVFALVETDEEQKGPFFDLVTSAVEKTFRRMQH